MFTRLRQAGISLIELVIFIVIVSVAVAGVLSVFSTAVKGSADPMIRKQAIAIAESLLTEVESQAFTWCDPQDANVLTATSAAGCAVAANDQNKGGAALTSPTPGTETRYSAATPFDNVADYGGFSKANIDDVTGGNVITGYTASIAITRAGGIAPFAALPADAVLRIDVTVSGNGESVTLTGYRMRYAPRAAG